MDLEMNVIDDLTLNISAPDVECAAKLERSLYSFARGTLLEVLDRVLSEEKFDGDLELDSLTVDVPDVNCENALEDFAEKLPAALKKCLSKAVIKKRCVPLAQMLADVFRPKLPMEKTFNLDKQIASYVENWIDEHSGSKFDSLSVAEYIVKMMLHEHPNLNAQQIAYTVYQKVKQMEAPAKKHAETVDLQNSVCDSGLVLLTPYIPMLLGRMNLAVGAMFKSEESRLKALALLRYAAFGEYRAPEKYGFLANVICDFAPNFAPEKMPELTDEEKSLVDSLLDAVVKNWGAIGKTSANGLRTSFLIRQGKLSEEDGILKLNVASSAFDMLLDKLPWGYTMLKFPWKKQKIEVKWR